jgi:hypothetical protein
MSLNAKQLVPGFRFMTGPTFAFTIVNESRATNGRVMFTIRRDDGQEFEISRVSLLRDKRGAAVAA